MKTIVKSIAGILLTVALSLTGTTASMAGSKPVPDLILINGKIITVDETFSIRTGLAVRGDRILAVGNDAAMRALAGPATRVVDLHGRAVIPGLIDNHNHFIRATEHWANEARLDGVTSRRQALAILHAKAAALPAEAWVLTLGGWFEDQFVDQPQGFTRAELDHATGDHPTFVQSMYDHAFVNSAWLKAMGIPVTRSGGAGAKISGLGAFVVRDATGRATGRLNGGFPMIAAAMRRFPPVLEAAQVAGIKAAMAYYNSLGLTTVYDPGGMGIQDASYARLQKLADAQALTLRIFYTLWGGMGVDSPRKAARVVARINANHPFQGDVWYDRIAFGEVYYPRFHWDRIMRAVHPTPEDVAAARSILMAAAAGGWPVQTHAVQPENIDRLFAVMADINRVHPLRALRWSVTHADMIGAPQIARARDLGVNLQLRSQRVIGGSAAAFKKYGEAVYHMPPLRLVADSGITFGLGTDGTKAAQINPFVTLWWATTGKMLNGQVILKEVLTRQEALIAHTRSNAWMTFQEANLGAIRPGLLADMLVLDRDYLTVPLDDIKNIRPVATIVAGQVVYGALN